MASSLFQITAEELLKKIVPKDGESTLLIGDDEDADLPTEDAEEILNDKEEEVLGRVPSRYRQLLRTVDGEFLATRANGGETAFQTSLAPIVAGSLLLYKNLAPVSFGDRDSSLALADSDFDVDLEDGTITLATALSRGDSLIAEYRHTGARRARQLRDWVLTLAAVEVSRRFDLADPNENFERWESSVFAGLANLRGIDSLDRIPLVDRDTEPEKFYQRVLSIDGGGPRNGSRHFDMRTKRHI